MPRRFTENLTTPSIRVTLDADKQSPAAFCWRQRVYHVSEVRECWRLGGDWWNGEGEKTYFRVVTQEGGVFEISYDHSTRTWSLERIED